MKEAKVMYSVIGSFTAHQWAYNYIPNINENVVIDNINYIIAKKQFDYDKGVLWIDLKIDK